MFFAIKLRTHLSYTAYMTHKTCKKQIEQNNHEKYKKKLFYVDFFLRLNSKLTDTPLRLMFQSILTSSGHVAISSHQCTR